MGCDPKFSARGKTKVLRKESAFHLSVSGSICFGARREEEGEKGRRPRSMEGEMEMRRLNSWVSESHEKLREGIALLLSQWIGLQMAVHNQWGGHDSLRKSHQLAADIFCWISQSRGRLQLEDIENLLHETMLFSFNTEIEDGSIEEVAEQLMIMHEEYMHATY